MRVKGNNKGYSLVELLITLAIFGIVMIGIAMIMRTTSVSYVNSSNEVAMQTEAQIVANQIEELIVDLNYRQNGDGTVTGSTIGTGTKDGYVEYYINDVPNGVKYCIVHNDDTDELWYDKVGITATTNPLADYSLMAEYVSTFSIDGWSTAEGNVDRDNKVTIEIAMDKDGYTYEVTRDVFFRNAVEDLTVYELDGGGSGPDPSDPTPYSEVVEVNRYEVVNLDKECGIKLVTSVTDNFNSMYKCVNITEATGNEQLFKAVSSVSDTSSYTPYIMTNDTVSTSAGFNMSCNAATQIMVTGNTKVDGTGETKTVLLTTPKVSFDLDKTNVAADGAVYLSTNTGDGGGGYMWLGVEGIDIASMVYTNSAPYSYALVAYTDDGDQVYTYDSANTPSVVKVTSVSHGYSDGVSLVLNDCGVQKGLALKADPEENGFIIVQDNNALSATPEALTAMSNGNYRMSIMIHFPGQTNEQSHTVVDFALVAHGTDMQNYQGANYYTATPSDWGVTFN